MSLRYRIVYDNPAKYRPNQKISTKAKHFIPPVIIILIVLSLTFSPYRANFFDFILPGNPNVTRHALQEFSDNIDRGECLGNALDAFCDAVMVHR